jgi:aspartate aminotransferase-like enzyme
MNYSTINVSTGPVQISPKVLAALASAPISHRSQEFYRLYNDLTEYLCKQFNTQYCYLLSGSGTAANEAMMCQLKLIGGKGIILSNGEFGERLIKQASHCLLEFSQVKLSWGEEFDIGAIEREIQKNDARWLLFCHCETSTGVVNNLHTIANACNRNKCLCFVDCMSTIGTCSLDLSKIAMATASSGKGLASIPGLAIVFANIKPYSSNDIPAYFDLTHYDKTNGVPYTISSNLVNALNVAVKDKLDQKQLELMEAYTQRCFNFFNDRTLLPFNNSQSKVFTISASDSIKNKLQENLKKEKVVFGYESEYLRSRNWYQIALLGYYQQSELTYFLNVLKRSVF